MTPEIQSTSLVFMSKLNKSGKVHPRKRKIHKMIQDEKHSPFTTSLIFDGNSRNNQGSNQIIPLKKKPKPSPIIDIGKTLLTNFNNQNKYFTKSSPSDENNLTLLNSPAQVNIKLK